MSTKLQNEIEEIAKAAGVDSDQIVTGHHRLVAIAKIKGIDAAAKVVREAFDLQKTTVETTEDILSALRNPSEKLYAEFSAKQIEEALWIVKAILKEGK